jgi:glutathione peroxidase
MEKTAQPSAYDFSFDALKGGALPFAQWRGKPVLVVNTASECGFTKQYTLLQELWQTYRARGLIVLGVPCNDFGGQEPGDAPAIGQFCAANFGVDFPLTAKYHVVGKVAHPFYRWANGWAGLIGSPKWNFHKYLIGPEGQMIDWFAPTTEPGAAKIIRAIEPLLPTEKVTA